MIRSRLTAQRLAFLFLLGCFFFNYPLLSVFNRSGNFFGMPPLYAWLMAFVDVLRVAADCGALRGSVTNQSGPTL